MLKFTDKYIYRIARMPRNNFSGQAHFDNRLDFLKKELSKTEVQEAIYLSSPEFFKEVERFLIGELTMAAGPKKWNKFQVTALKYLNRISYRPTPFGMFAGCGVGKVMDSSALEAAPTAPTFRREIKLDAAYLMLLSNGLLKIPGINAVLKFFPNNTILEVGAKSRYVEYSDTDHGRAYNLSVFSNSEYLDRVRQAAVGGATGLEIAEVLVDEDITVADALGFVSELVDAKILVSELEPHVVGNPFQDQLESVLTALLQRRELTDEVAVEVRKFYGHLQHLIELMEAASETGSIASYRAIENLVAAFQGKPYPNVIRLDAEVRNEVAPRLDFQMARKVQKGLRALIKLCRYQSSRSIVDFRNKFSARYEEQLVPVMLALDPELGVGFEKVGSEQFTFTPLVDNLPMVPRLGSNKRKKVEWNYKLHNFLLQKMISCQVEGKRVLQLTDEDLDGFHYEMSHVPPTSAAMFSVVQEEGADEPLYCFKDLGKDTGAALLSRFAHMSGEIKEVVDDLCNFEEESFAGSVVAEINHLANLRVGNITERPRSRKHEIAFITKSNSDEGGLIPITDLYVGVRNNRVVLVSKKLGKEIIPRVSTAHNYAWNCLPLYKFLASLQEEYHGGYYEYLVDLGPITGMLDFVPRIQYERFVFRRASWNILTQPIKNLKELPFADMTVKLRELFKENNWPTRFTLRDGDAPVYVDLQNDHSIYLFINMLKGYRMIIEEVIEKPTDAHWFNDGAGAHYQHEVMLPFRNETFLNRKAKPVPAIIETEDTLPRVVYPSDEWLYLKFYGGAGTIEKLVGEKFPLLIKGLADQGLITSFFFLRLTDPDYHLRVRFKPSNYAAIGEILRQVNEFFKPELEHQFIWKIQVDTYRRELERYAGPNLAAGEALFAVDSKMVMSVKNLLVSEVQKDLEWLVMLSVMNIYLEVFGLKDADARAFLKERRETFSYLFNTNKLQKRDLVQRYLNHRPQIEEALQHNRYPFEQEALLHSILAEFKDELTTVYDEGIAPLDKDLRAELLQSYVHMFILRFSRAKNKIHEHVLFFILERYYLQEAGKKRKSVPQLK
ncbi:lantibiotic dehydratase [Neolewinella agarilytica]|uniref:Thiopeptide-type bacteriocin biosynthesis domain-containing protein n=1 Tax=Neolewinella agarilytica TaxID=478744 RepID=A0A1H9KD54_9BACT|nr:lantibiotic dehydratase [Neolewinella agarilytica]SEQ97136.1 thiopeptide-type bacteriocin biosynthesis domain-containing protein [Neolewinella agarilytica]